MAPIVSRKNADALVPMMLPIALNSWNCPCSANAAAAIAATASAIDNE